MTDLIKLTLIRQQYDHLIQSYYYYKRMAAIASNLDAPTTEEDKATDSSQKQQEQQEQKEQPERTQGETKLTETILPLHPDEITLKARPATLTEKERKVLEEFRQMIDPLELAQRKMKYESSDLCLLRVLRSDGFKLDKCKQMWDLTTEWYRGKQIDISAVNIIFPEGNVTTQQILQKYPFGVIGTDRRGRPISYKLAGIVDQTIFSEVGIDRLVQWEAVVASKTVHYLLPKCSLDAGYHIENYVQIVDLSGMSMVGLLLLLFLLR